ncbi:MAG: hypothetical protein II155_00020 [Clostridia bacterium]|jgi:predicted membrane-bound dolichyl-phosphate-mannose-protein mannosyltransferase|nr:hypothetical protein [Clostridia bacterium]
MKDFFTWSTLMTYSGATLATTLMTQLIKEIPFVKRIPSRLVSYIIAVVIMVLAALATKSFEWSGLVMAFINASAVALAANGAFDAIRK